MNILLTYLWWAVILVSTDLLRIIKRAALEVVENSKPTVVMTGIVESIDPIEIRINQKLILNADCLINTNNINSLNLGDKTALLRIQGGQKYIVLDVMQ